MEKANLIIDDVNIDLTDEENLCYLKSCLEYARAEAKKDYDYIQSKDLFKPDKKADDRNVFWFAGNLLKKLGFDIDIKDIAS